MFKETNLIEQLPGYIWWKDMNSIFLKTNANSARILGFTHPDELIGIKDHDVRCKAAENAMYYVEEDQKVQSSSTPMSFLNLSTYLNDEVTVLFVQKALFFDVDSTPLGVAGQGIELNKRLLKNLPLLWEELFMRPDKKNRTTYHFSHGYGDIALSKRQAQCLFYVLRGKTCKMIAKILQLSPRTVESYLDDIKAKMGCLNKVQLIEKAIDLGFLEIIPPGIITHPFINS